MKAITFEINEQNRIETVKISNGKISNIFRDCRFCRKSINIGDVYYKVWKGIICEYYKSGSTVIYCENCKNSLVNNTKIKKV